MEDLTGCSLDRAVAELRSGALLAYPTETLFGLGADGRCPTAVERLCSWKGREPENPLPILVEGSEALARLGVELSPFPRELAEAFWPGPLMLVLPCARSLPREWRGRTGLSASAAPSTRWLPPWRAGWRERGSAP